MTTTLATVKDMPTHRLIVRIPSADYKQNEVKVIKLTSEQAMSLLKVVNDRSVENLVLTSPGIIPNPPAFYPKKWCYLEPIPEHEKKSARANYDRLLVQRARELDEKAGREKQAATIDNWIRQHPDDWIRLNNKLEKDTKTIQGIGISEGYINALRGARARGIVAELLKLK